MSSLFLFVCLSVCLPVCPSVLGLFLCDISVFLCVNVNSIPCHSSSPFAVRLRLGLDDGRVKPVKEVGRRFNISWKQVRSIEKDALNKLLGSSEITEFVDSFHSV